MRRWAEGQAKLLAVVSLPEDTFKSSDASVKASLVFLKKFTDYPWIHLDIAGPAFLDKLAVEERLDEQAAAIGVSRKDLLVRLANSVPAFVRAIRTR